MAVHDYILSNQSGSSFRSDLNNALAAIVSQNSNATEPATTYSYQYWVDTSATPALIKQRNAANDDWVVLAEVDGQTLAADGTDAKPGISFAADINTGLKRNAADDVSIVTGGTQAITVDSSQNVGIGTTSPSSALHLSSSAPVVTITDTDTSAIHTINADSSGANVSINIDTTEVGDSDAKSSLILSTHGDERLRIEGGTGNVGLGDTGPDARLHIRADGNEVKNLLLLQNRDSGASAASQIASVNSTNDYGDNRYSYIRFITTGSGQNGNKITFGTNSNGGAPAERMRIQSDGRVLIGTTSDGGAGGISIRPNASNGATSIIWDRANTTATTYALAFENNNGTVGSIRYNNTTTSYVTSSDYRLKENVVDITDGITRLKQLAPKRFNFIASPGTIVDGFLAHEAQTVVPEAVAGAHDAVKVWTEDEELPDGVSVGDNKLDDDGNTIPDYQGIDQSKLVPLLTAALQEAIAKIETLETKVAALEAAN